MYKNKYVTSCSVQIGKVCLVCVVCSLSSHMKTITRATDYANYCAIAGEKILVQYKITDSSLEEHRPKFNP